MDYFLFLLNKLPRVAFSKDGVVGLDATGARLAALTVTSTAGVTTSGFASAATTTTTTGSTTTSTTTTTPADEEAAAAGSTGSTSGTTTTATAATTAAAPAVAPQVLDIDTSMLAVVIQPTAATTGTTGATAADGTTVAAPPKPAVDLSAIKDTEPPVLALKGAAFTQVLQATAYADAGASAFDNVDGAAVTPRSRLALCQRPEGAELWAADSTTALACGFGIYASVDTAAPTNASQIWVVTYTARDVAGNNARPLRRLVEVAPRCADPERWCADLAKCSVRGQCSALLASIAAAAVQPVGAGDAAAAGGGGGSATASASAAASAAAAAAAAAAYVPPVDRTPPKLKLLGAGVAAVTPAGAALMVDDVTWNAEWRDPGATAHDAVDGDVSARIQRLGVGEARAGCSVPDLASPLLQIQTIFLTLLFLLPHLPSSKTSPKPAGVSTALPTPPDRSFSFVVEYNVDDASGNAAPTARRLVRVVCPPPEAFCLDPESGGATCTVGGVCGRPAALALFAAAATTPTAPGSAASPAAAASAAGAATSSAAAAAAKSAAALATPPNITLLGAPAVELQAGDPYDRCAATAPLNAVCDRGAAAADALDGALDRAVTVCGSPWRAAGGVRLAPVLLACGVNGSVPGEYNVTFTATNSAGLSASVTRAVTIRARCPVGEALCPDKVTCSEGGSCLVAARGGGSSSAATGGAASAAAASGTVTAAAAVTSGSAAAVKLAEKARSTAARPANQPPRIALRAASDALAGANVFVRRVFGSYPACRKESKPTVDEPCEPGASAFDPDGGGDGKGLDISDDVVVCPPPACVQGGGCSPGELRRHHFGVKGLAGCAFDPMAAEGTVFPVTFWVFDGGAPVLNASVTRTVTLSKACPTAAAPNLCGGDGSGNSGGSSSTTTGYYCSGAPCGQAAKLLPPAPRAARLELLPSAGTVFLPYGRASAFSLAPCRNGSANATCGATAWELDADGGEPADLSASIEVRDVTPCDGKAVSREKEEGPAAG